MSANTKIVVLRRKELLYTGIFAALGVLFIILLLMLLLPGKDTDATYGTPDSPDGTAAAEMPDNVADVSTGAVADTGNTYIPGIYTTELILGNETVNVEVIVSDHTPSHPSASPIQAKHLLPCIHCSSPPWNP